MGCSYLKILLGRSRRHLFPDILDQLRHPSFQKHNNLFNHRLVDLRGYGPAARTQTKPHLVVQAGSFSALGGPALALADFKGAMDHFQGLSHGTGRGKRAKI